MANKDEATVRFEAMLAGNASVKRTVAEFLKSRLQAKTDALMTCNKDTFETAKGRCLELTELLKLSE